VEQSVTHEGFKKLKFNDAPPKLKPCDPPPATTLSKPTSICVAVPPQAYPTPSSSKAATSSANQQPLGASSGIADDYDELFANMDVDQIVAQVTANPIAHITFSCFTLHFCHVCACVCVCWFVTRSIGKLVG
jgi:hypothetical protein